MLTETVPCSCDPRRTSKKTSEKMPGNLGLAMKELDAAEVRAVTFFLFFFERLPGVINRGCRTMFMHQQEGG